MVAAMTAADNAIGIGAARRIVLKIGSALLIDDASGALRRDWLRAFADDVARLRGDGREVAIVSSGAIAFGRRQLGLSGKALALEEKQAAAAVGQIHLAHAWQEALAAHGLTLAQILLSLADTEERRRHLNARETLGRPVRIRRRAADQRERYGGDRGNPLRRQRPAGRPGRADGGRRPAGPVVGHRRAVRPRSRGWTPTPGIFPKSPRSPTRSAPWPASRGRVTAPAAW